MNISMQNSVYQIENKIMKSSRGELFFAKDLGLVEQLGSGITRILEHYGKECFVFSDNFLRMSFPVEEAYISKSNQDSNYEGNQDSKSA